MPQKSTWTEYSLFVSICTDNNLEFVKWYVVRFNVQKYDIIHCNPSAPLWSICKNGQFEIVKWLIIHTCIGSSALNGSFYTFRANAFKLALLAQKFDFATWLVKRENIPFTESVSIIQGAEFQDGEFRDIWISDDLHDWLYLIYPDN